MKKILAVILTLAMLLSLSAAAFAEKKVDTDFAQMTWDEILAEAKGQTVNWYLWGGSTVTNDFIDNVIGAEAAKYGVSINRVGVSNITEAVNMVISEKQANKTENGTVDIFWINGSNFMMMKQAGVTFPNWAESLPNAKYVNWEDPAIANDMGLPVEGQESPWMSAQLQIIYDSARISEDELPRSYAELLEWAKKNPGRFTYPAPPDFIGTRFIKAGIYELTGGYEGYTADDITMEQLEEKAKPMFDWLTEIEPYLWREGSTYPQSSTDLTTMFSNSEVDFCFTMDGMGIPALIENGIVADTSRVYCMDTAIADTNYVALSFNGANKAGALVIANIILEPAIQAENIVKTGGAPAIDGARLNEEETALMQKALDTLPMGSYVTDAEKARTRAPEISSYLNPYIEQLWAEKIAK